MAIVGGGPAGLSAAHDLALLGFKPVVFELEQSPAGMLAHGIPEYRLPRELIRREVEVIRSLGVEMRFGTAVGRDVSFADLRRDHIDLPVLASYLCEFEELLTHDGCAGIAVMAPGRTVEVVR